MKRLFVYLFLIFFISGGFGWSAYITKKSDTSKSVEKIEKDYANGKISKSECIKKKSKILKLAKVSQTICDNVTVKVVKKSKYIQKKSKEEKKVEYIKKKEKKEKKIKKKFTDKKKKLSKKVKKWISKKVKKEKKHYKTIASLPKSDFYFTAVDEEGNTYIGYTNTKISDGREVSEGKGFQDDKKTQCNVLSEVLKSTTERMTGSVIIKCPTKEFIGSWTQTGTLGFGRAQSAKTFLDFSFSVSRKDAIASLKNKKKESKETKQLVKLEEKNYEEKDNIKPVITISYNNNWFSSKNHKEVNIKKYQGKCSITGIVSDKGGSSKEALNLIAEDKNSKNRKKVSLDGDTGRFQFNCQNWKSEKLYLVATDSSGNSKDFLINIENLSDSKELVSKEFVNKANYYALLIGNSNYKNWEPLISPINDVEEIGKVLRNKYKFKEVVILKDATKEEIEEGIENMADLVKSNDNLLIYYSGHGQTRVKEGDGKQKFYWIPINGKKEFSNRTWLSTGYIKDMADNFSARHVLLMVDSCFAGAFITKGNTLYSKEELANVAVETLRKNVDRIGREYISSGNIEEVEDTSGKYSAFARAFITELENNDGHLMTPKLFLNLKMFVEGKTQQDPQHYFIKGVSHSKGRFVFSKGG